MRTLVVSNSLNKRSIQNIQRMRYIIDSLCDDMKDKTVNPEKSLQMYLSILDDYRAMVCAGKFINHVFRKFHIMNATKTIKHLKEIQKRHPDHTLPLQDLINGVKQKPQMYIVQITNSNPKTKMPKAISINPDISRNKGLEIVKTFRKLIKKYVPTKYLKYKPYL